MGRGEGGRGRVERGRVERGRGTVKEEQKQLIKPGLNQPCQLVINDDEQSVIYRPFL